MANLPDDPIVASMLRTGYPPWIDPGWEDDEDEWEEEAQMCILGTRPKRSKEAESDRYRRFEIAKRHIPQNMLPREYEEEIKRLARKYKI